MFSDTWPLLGTDLNMTFYGPPAVGSTPDTDGAYQNHPIVEAKVIHELIPAITGLVATWTQPGQGQWFKCPVWSQ